MYYIRNPFTRPSRAFTRYFQRRYSGPPPTYPVNDPIHISPGVLERRSPLRSFLQIFLAGAFVGLPGYWILWLGQKVSIPYCTLQYGNRLILDVDRLDSFQTSITTEQKAKLASTPSYVCR